MRNINLFIFALLLSCSVATAQITITNTDLPQVGVDYVLSVDTVTQFDFTQTGANHSWDYSTLTPIFQRTDTYTDEVPPVYDFPDATHVHDFNAPAFGPVEIANAFEFFRITADAYERLGFGGEVTQLGAQSLSNNPVDTLFTLPLNYQDQGTSFSSAEFSIAFLGVFVRTEQTRTYNVDGWGSLTTPFGTFDVLRVQTEITGYDTASAPAFQLEFGNTRDPQTIYSWYAPEQGIPVMEATSTTIAGIPTPGGIQYQDTLQTSTGIWDDVRNPLQVNVYPNPASDQLQVILEEAVGKGALMEIVNMEGQVIYEATVGSSSASMINLTTFPAGTYVVRISTQEKNYTGKLVIDR